MPRSTVFKRCFGHGVFSSGYSPQGLLVVLIAALFLSACEKPAEPAPAKGAVEVAVVEIKARDVRLSTELPGRTLAYRVAEVRPQVGGIIAERLFVKVVKLKRVMAFIK